MRAIVCLTVFPTSLSVQAHILHLRDGSRHYGTLIKPTKNEVVFRIALADGASALRRFPASQVKHVECTAVERREPASIESGSLQ